MAGKATFNFTGQVDSRKTLAVWHTFHERNWATDAVFNNALNTSVLTLGLAKPNDYITALNAPVFFGAIPTFGTAVKADFGLSVCLRRGILDLFLTSCLVFWVVMQPDLFTRLLDKLTLLRY